MNSKEFIHSCIKYLLSNYWSYGAGKQFTLLRDWIQFVMFTIRDVGKFIQPKEEEHRRREIRRGSG